MAFNLGKIQTITQSVSLGKNVILHGSGGTGKSYSLKAIASDLQSKGMRVFCTATTGIAAVNLGAGSHLQTRTLHSWSGIGLGKEDKDKLLAKVASKSRNRKRWQKTDVLIIDEISMLGASLFDKLNYIGKKIRRCDFLPFGGMQLIVSGDFLQLPPINDKWVFESDAWKECDFQWTPFLTPVRYDDDEWFHILLRIRSGQITPSDYSKLEERVKAYDDLQKEHRTKRRRIEGEQQIQPTVLYSKKMDVSNFNASKLDKLPGECFMYFAEDEYKQKESISTRTQSYYEKMLDDAIPSMLQFKPGSQVMLKTNLDIQNGLANGSRGVVLECFEDAVMVKFRNDQKIRVSKQVWEWEDDNMLATRSQIPLIMAWGLTIHSCQGCTLDYAVCDLGTSVFENAQAYVALSRVRSLEGLLISSLYKRSFLVNKKALQFVNKCDKLYNKTHTTESK